MRNIFITVLSLIYILVLLFLCIFKVPFIIYTGSSKKVIDSITYQPLWYIDKYIDISIVRLGIEIFVLTIVFAVLMLIVMKFKKSHYTEHIPD